jgi:DNA-binding LytR/AlgR family response regulator
MTKCLIIDDEEPARELIKLHLSTLDGFQVVGELDNVIEATAFLQKKPADLLFLDINMPKMTGVDFLRSGKTNCPIILTTAYRDYAPEAFEFDVVDYLLKPITGERFHKAISKFKNHRPNYAYRYFKVGRDQVKVFLADIIFIEGLADYIKIHTKDQHYIASEKLGYIEDQLIGHSFVRIHRSFIVPMEKVTGYNAGQVFLGTQSVPLGRLYKYKFLTAISQKPI